MAILNKKSMLFLLATTLLICSSYADDHLSSAGMEERAFTSKIFEKIAPWIRSQYPDRIEKGLDFFKEIDGSISTLCTKKYCNPRDQKCSGALCVYKWATKKPIDCQKSCTEERSLTGSPCHYDFKSGKFTGRC